MTYAMPRSRKKKKKRKYGEREIDTGLQVFAMHYPSILCNAMLCWGRTSRREHRLRIRTEPILRGNTVDTVRTVQVFCELLGAETR